MRLENKTDLLMFVVIQNQSTGPQIRDLCFATNVPKTKLSKTIHMQIAKGLLSQKTVTQNGIAIERHYSRSKKFYRNFQLRSVSPLIFDLHKTLQKCPEGMLLSDLAHKMRVDIRKLEKSDNNQQKYVYNL